MDRKTIGTCALLLIIAGASASLFFTRPGGTLRINLNPYQALGAVAAEETSKLLNHQGQIVIVVNDPGDERDPVVEAQLEAFRRTLKKTGKLAVQAVERVKMDALTRMNTGGTMPPDQFLTLKAKHLRADALVLFIGFPLLPPGNLNALKASQTKLVVISAALPGYRELLRTGVIQLAIVPKQVSANEGTVEPKNLRDWFIQEFQIFTPATADGLPF
jgi:hypothetical protein